jgi:hypothetical protein
MKSNVAVEAKNQPTPDPTESIIECFMTCECLCSVEIL